MRITITARNDGPPSEKLEIFRSGLLRVHQLLGEEYKNFVQMNFEEERDPNGTPWKPLAESTARRWITKKHRRGHHPILRVSGRLSNVHVEADENHVTIGSNLSYAPIHQFGGMAGRGKKAKIPARPWLFGRDGSVPQKFQDALRQIVEKELEHALAD